MRTERLVSLIAGSVLVLGASMVSAQQPAAAPLEGGIPIVVDGKLIGAIGASGVLATQGAQIARAGIENLK